MRGRNKTDVVTSQFILKIYHAFSQSMKIHLPGSLMSWVLAYPRSLAINTPHVAIAETMGRYPEWQNPCSFFRRLTWHSLGQISHDANRFSSASARRSSSPLPYNRRYEGSIPGIPILWFYPPLRISCLPTLLLAIPTL